MIDLYTDATPNGWKASVTLEEIGMEYAAHRVDITTGAQKEDWFLELCPNGRIPAIVDREEGDLAIFESGAIMIHLAEKIPPSLRGARQASGRIGMAGRRLLDRGHRQLGLGSHPQMVGRIHRGAGPSPAMARLDARASGMPAGSRGALQTPEYDERQASR